MAITSETNRTAELATNSSETEFDFPMLIHDESELLVFYKTTGGTYSQIVLNTNYTVEFGESGGTVTTIGDDSPYAEGSILIIRHLPITQQTNWMYNDNHTEQTHQDDFDRAAMRDLQIQEQLDRCPGFSITSSTKNIEFPEPSADKLIGWSSESDELENKVVVTGITIPAMTQGSVPFGNSAGSLTQDNDNFYYDDANNTLRVKRLLVGGVF